MSGQSTAVATGGAAVAALAGGPLAEVFNETTLVLAIWGAAGGTARGIGLRVPWREIVRGAVLGALLASGLGVLLPHITGPLLSAELPTTVPVLAACAYLVGLWPDLIIARLQRGAKQ
jgi:hypothetical protein